MTELTYTKNGDYLIPDLTLSETPEDARPLGKYGRLRRSYLQEHRPGLYSRLVLSEKLFPHLREIDETANRRLEQMMPELMKLNGVTEELKARDQMKWVGLMNNLKAQAEARAASESEGTAASASGSAAPVSKSEDEEYCIVEPDTLAMSVIRGLHISPEQIDYYYDRPEYDLSQESATVVPASMKPVVSQVNIKAHVKGLKYARGTTLSFLRGVAAGYDISTQTNSTDRTAHAFVLNNRKFDAGSDSDGTITASFLSFGLIGDGTTDSRYYLDINFVLINGEPYPLTFDVTDLISVDVSLYLTLNLDLELVLPEVVAEEGGGGFKTDVSECEDEVLDIPI